MLCCQFKVKQWTRDLFLVGYLPMCCLAGPFCQNIFYHAKICLAHYAKTFFYQTKIWRMNNNHNCKSNNFVKTIQPHLQINPIIYQCCNYMDHDTSMILGDGGRSEEKRTKIWDVGPGQRRRGAMLSVQNKAMD